jgi:hypothetical protein
MAAEYRASKEQYADGIYKLSSIYGGFEPARDDSDDVWQARQVQLQNWIRAKPDSPTPRIAIARVLTSYAWKARGGDWAHNVKQQDWETFFSRLNGALKYLQDASKLQQRCPVYWTSLQRIALGLQFDRSRYDSVFSQATREFPDFESYYYLRATYLLPRWNGTQGEWETDLSKSADAIGGESGDKVYARVVWYMHSCGFFTNIFTESKGLSWARIDKGFEAILKESPGSLSAQTERAHLAALVGDRQKARNYFLQTQGQVDVCLWDGKDAFESSFKWMFPH